MATPNVAAIIIGAIASITICLLDILFALFLMHRRRQCAIFIISLAQEEANRRRRKRQKAGLRRWKIESACPEAIVSIISDSVSSPTVHSQQDHPKQYQSEMAALRSANLLPDLPPIHLTLRHSNRCNLSPILSCVFVIRQLSGSIAHRFSPFRALLSHAPFP